MLKRKRRAKSFLREIGMKTEIISYETVSFDQTDFFPFNHRFSVNDLYLYFIQLFELEIHNASASAERVNT